MKTRSMESIDRTAPLLKRVWGRLLDGLFPQACIYCGGGRKAGGEYLCGLCRKDILFIERPYCNRCGAPAEISYDYPHDNFECGLCRRQPFAFDHARSLGPYDSVLRALIHHFKYGKQPRVMVEIAPLLETYFEKDRDTCRGLHVCPVPLHFRKLKSRTFDQSYLLGKQVAGILGLPLEDEWLRRVREKEPQATLRRSERKKNVVGAFETDAGASLKGKDILLVDDVFTTGATLNEAARVLKRAGAGRVHAFTLARA